MGSRVRNTHRHALSASCRSAPVPSLTHRLPQCHPLLIGTSCRLVSVPPLTHREALPQCHLPRIVCPSAIPHASSAPEPPLTHRELPARLPPVPPLWRLVSASPIEASASPTGGWSLSHYFVPGLGNMCGPVTRRPSASDMSGMCERPSVRDKHYVV